MAASASVIRDSRTVSFRVEGGVAEGKWRSSRRQSTQRYFSWEKWGC